MSKKNTPTPAVEPRKPVGIWIRVSTEFQAQGDSPVHHEQRARNFAESREWEVREVYHLEAVSGKAVMDHPEAKRMLADLKAGKIKALIFSKLARLARNTRELLDFADIFRAQGADLVSLQESIDTSTPAGRLFYSMIAGMAQWEREEIASRVTASVAIRAKMGKVLSYRATYGFHIVDGKIVPHPQEAPIRKQIHELFVEHRRVKKVMRMLNEAGHRTRTGTLWSDKSINYLLRDTTAKGLYCANRTKRSAEGRSVKPEAEWVWHNIEPIVSEEVWDQCQAILDSNPKHPGRTKAPTQLFAGFVFCHCGKKMYVRTNTPKYICEGCRNKIPVEDLEAVFIDELKNFAVSPGEINAHLEKANTNIAEKERLLVSIQSEYDKVAAEIKKIYRLHMDEVLDGKGFGQLYKPLQERQTQLDNELPRLQAEVDILKINQISSEQVITEVTDLHRRWTTLERDEKHRIIESITEKIIIGDGEIEINLYHVVSSEELTKGLRTLWSPVQPPPWCCCGPRERRRRRRPAPIPAGRACDRRWRAGGLSGAIVHS